MKRPEALQKIKDTIKKVAPDATIILYGSEARGDAKPNSDFDILILEDVERITYQRRKEISYPLYMLYYDEGINVQPMIKTRREWENRKCVTPFYLNVINEGIEI